MPYQSAPSLLRRWLAGLLALMIGLGPLASPAYAALTPLADEPINIKNQAKPNIILTVDDSTSMLYDFLPDYVASNKYCRDAHGRDEHVLRLQRLAGQHRSRRAVRLAAVHLGTAACDAARRRRIRPTRPAPAQCRPRFSPQLFSNSGPGAGCNRRRYFPIRRAAPAASRPAPRREWVDLSGRVRARRRRAAVRILVVVAGARAQQRAQPHVLQPAAHL